MQKQLANPRGGGLLRSLGGWAQVLSLRRKGRKVASDGQILGSGEFTGQLPADAALVIGAQATPAKAYLLNQPPVEVAAIPWYADAKGEAWQALEMKGTPVIIGIRKGRMEWVISGLLKDSATLTSAIRTRVDY